MRSCHQFYRQAAFIHSLCWRSGLQTVYLIEVANVQLKRVCRHTIPEHHRGEYQFKCCADSRLVVLQIADEEASLCKIEAFTRDGCHLAHSITFSWGSSLPDTAYLEDSRIAFADVQSFVVWGLRSGHRLSTQHPPADLQRPASPTAGPTSRLVVSPSGAKLAFCADDASTVHLYDAASLALLGSVNPFAGVRPFTAQ